MINPTKHEDLSQNLLVLGGEIIKVVRHNPHNVEDVYQIFKKEVKDSALDRFYDAITFLWLLDFINVDEGIIELNKSKNVSEETLF